MTNKLDLLVKSSITGIEDFNREMNHNFLVIKNDSISHTGDWYGPPDPPPSRETFKYMSIRGFETIEQVKEYILEQTENSPANAKNFKVIKAQFLEIKTSVSVDFS